MTDTGPRTRRYAGTSMPTTIAVPLPQCCPVSGNPHPGSAITISYTTAGRVLDVEHLPAYLSGYVGGLVRGGRVATRDMEGMIQRIAYECAAALGAPVTVDADLRIAPGDQRMQIRASASVPRGVKTDSLGHGWCHERLTYDQSRDMCARCGCVYHAVFDGRWKRPCSG